jgi:septum site-determining protein MinC
MSVKPEGTAPATAPNYFEIKSTQLSTVALLLRSDNVQAVATELLKQFGPASENSEFFERDAVVIDLAVMVDESSHAEFASLLNAIRQCHLVPFATRNAPSAWKPHLQSLSLVEVPAEIARVKSKVSPQPSTESLPGQVIEVIKEVQGPGTMVIDKPLRSGQKVYARSADLVVLAMVNQGAEVVADGNIHVYAPLRGKAMAGARGNTNARIFSTCLEPELISIAGVYRTSETPLPKDIAGKAAQVRLSTDGQENLIIESLKT